MTCRWPVASWQRCVTGFELSGSSTVHSRLCKYVTKWQLWTRPFFAKLFSSWQVVLLIPTLLITLMSHKHRNIIKPPHDWPSVRESMTDRCTPQKARNPKMIQKNIERHTAHTIVSWPNPKHIYIYIFSQSSQREWINWKHTAPHSVLWITERIC